MKVRIQYLEIIGGIIVIAVVGGWVANLVKLIGSNFDPITGMVVARAIGVFMAPLGAVLGFF